MLGCHLIYFFPLCIHTIKMYSMKFVCLLVQLSVYFSSMVNLGKISSLGFPKQSRVLHRWRETITLWQPLYYLTPSFLSSHFLFHPSVILPPSCFSFFPSLPPRERRIQNQVNTLICGRNLSHPHLLLFLSHSPHSLCRSSWLTPLCFKSRIPAQFSSILSPLTFMVV